MARHPTLRYRCRLSDGQPYLGDILMGIGPRTRRAYRIITAARIKNTMPMMGFVTWRVRVEPMSKAAGQREIDEGRRHWELNWDKRG